MATVCITDSHIGSIDRYEIGGEQFRRTHGCMYGQPVQFTPAFIENFRLMPPEEFSVAPPPKPTGPPTASGECQLPCDVEALAA